MLLPGVGGAGGEGIEVLARRAEAAGESARQAVRALTAVDPTGWRSPAADRFRERLGGDVALGHRVEETCADAGRALRRLARAAAGGAG
ncbi:hypothetical protein [Kineococcus gynurae]|uniref:hypothetical protein n=1 Tax=Kineococcus gynurae TaxID=452979 RepID=UPI0036D25EAD